MTTVQIVGIAVAAALVVLLIIALLVTRRRGGTEAAPSVRADASFLDAAPQDTLDALGRAEEPVEDVTLDAEGVRQLREEAGEAAQAPAAASLAAGAVPAAASPDDFANAVPSQSQSLSLDWGPPPEQPPPPLLESERRPLDYPPLAATPPVAEPAGPDAPVDSSSEPPAAAGQACGRKVPLSDIIVTTSRKVIDLDDPEVRRMLTDLVKFEIDQATRYREQGQDIDAVLQLTEAEKISRALGMNESASAIHTMLQDLQGRA